MSEDQRDPTSDAVRSDPKSADAARDKLSKEAEKGMREAVQGDHTEKPSNNKKQD